MKKVIPIFVLGVLVLVFLLLKVLFPITTSFLSPLSSKPLLDSQKEISVNSPISIDVLRSNPIVPSELIIEENLIDGSNYTQYIASYKSEGNKIYGLLTVPMGEMPIGGFPAVVFNHGYIPPSQYVTTERYVAYVDYLARNGFVVFKIDFRGNGRSEGDPSGSYFSSAYTIDALSALKSLQGYEKVNPKRIGMWGHSMAGNLILRAMLVSDEVKAGVIWAGAVYSYADFVKYRISDNSYVHRPYETRQGTQEANREVSNEIQRIRSPSEQIDFSSDFWKAVSLTQNLVYLRRPIALHHAVNDETVDVGYSRDLSEELKNQNKQYEYFEYDGGGHNIESPYFEIAMERTVSFFKKYL